jgi:hypothetical protein
LAKPRGPGALPPAILPFSSMMTKTFGIVHILVASTCDMRLSGFRWQGLLLIAFAVSLRGRTPAPS